MTDTEVEKTWADFARSIRGEISRTSADRVNFDNTVTIANTDVTLTLIWGDQPERGRGIHVNLQSIFKFKLNEHSSSLRIYPKDFLSTLLTLFSKKKTKIPAVDKKYIVTTNQPEIVFSISPALENLAKHNPCKNFVIFTSTEEKINYLNIQVNELLIHKEQLNFYYDFGISISKKLNYSK